MNLVMRKEILAKIQEHGEEAYPEEGAGFLLGRDGEERMVQDLVVLENARAGLARRNRYLLGPEAYLKAELEAGLRGLYLVGIFHSHPDHPNHPSEFDREWAQPVFSYVITSIDGGKATASKSWRLSDDRVRFDEETIRILA